MLARSTRPTRSARQTRPPRSSRYPRCSWLPRSRTCRNLQPTGAHALQPVPGWTARPCWTPWTSWRTRPARSTRFSGQRRRPRCPRREGCSWCPRSQRQPRRERSPRKPSQRFFPNRRRSGSSWRRWRTWSPRSERRSRQRRCSRPSRTQGTARTTRSTRRRWYPWRQGPSRQRWTQGTTRYLSQVLRPRRRRLLRGWIPPINPQIISNLDQGTSFRPLTHSGYHRLYSQCQSSLPSFSFSFILFSHRKFSSDLVACIV